MSKYDYHVSKKIAAQDYPFFAIIMAAARKADPRNLAALERAFPETVRELKDRYDAPGGILQRERTRSGAVDHQVGLTGDEDGVRAECTCGWRTRSNNTATQESYGTLREAMELHELTAK
jgi:hypothetical protein